MNEDLMRQEGFGKQLDSIKSGKCPLCNKVINENDFKDDLSRKEFKISGICQKCQDNIFKKEN